MRSARALLAPCSWLFSAAVRIRHFLYDRKIFIQKNAPLPVVSIGNIVAGGAGKTQATLMLAELLSKEMRVAILSRGYKSQSEYSKIPLLVNPITHSPKICGDEPWLLASRLRSVMIYVNKNRYKSAIEAKKMGAQLIILDDGMQHRKLHRDFEIVVIDGHSSLDTFLPKGTLRDRLDRLRTAHLILFVRSPEESIKKRISSFSSAPQVVTNIVSQGIYHLDGREVATLKDVPIAVFCGIGHPTRFVDTLEELGAHVLMTYFSRDHCLISQTAFNKFAVLAKSRGAKFPVCTEKDKVKLSSDRTTGSMLDSSCKPSQSSDLRFTQNRNSLNGFKLPIIWMKSALEVVENQEAWINIVNAIKFYVGQQV